MKTDVLIEESIKELFSKATEEYGNIHILCNNAGIGANSGNKAIWEIEKQDWDWVMGVNYQGVLQGIQTFLPHMIEHGEEGHVLTTVSLAGLLPGANSKFSKGIQGELEKKVMDDLGVKFKDFIIDEIPDLSSYGMYRPLFQKYNDINVEFDSGNPIFSFWLHKGTYATSFLREIMKSSDVTVY